MSEQDSHTSSEVTKEMAEAGGWCITYFRLYSDEPSDDKIAKRVFEIMVSVDSGDVTLDQVKDHIDPKRGLRFFEKSS